MYDTEQTTAPETSESTTETEMTTTTKETTTETTEETTTEAPTTETTEIKSDLTLKDFEKIDNGYSIKALVKEVGPYSRFECSGFYVWKLKDKTEIWVFKDTFTGNVRDILNVNGIEQTLIYSSMDESLYKETSYYGVKCICSINREFGPELERGWYSLEKDGGVYILYSSGKQDTRGTYVYTQRVRSETMPLDTLILTFDMETYTGTEELEETEKSPYPCSGVRLDRMPKNLVVTDINGEEIPFKGKLTEADIFPG